MAESTVWSWPNGYGASTSITPTVMITGYPDENISAKASSVGVRQVLLKPNLEDNLVECVRDAIDTRRAAGQP